LLSPDPPCEPIRIWRIRRIKSASRGTVLVSGPSCTYVYLNIYVVKFMEKTPKKSPNLRQMLNWTARFCVPSISKSNFRTLPAVPSQRQAEIKANKIIDYIYKYKLKHHTLYLSFWVVLEITCVQLDVKSLRTLPPMWWTRATRWAFETSTFDFQIIYIIYWWNITIWCLSLKPLRHTTISLIDWQ